MYIYIYIYIYIHIHTWRVPKNKEYITTNFPSLTEISQQTLLYPRTLGT